MAVHHARIFSSGAIRGRRVDKSAHPAGIPGWQDLAAILLVLGIVILANGCPDRAQELGPSDCRNSADRFDRSVGRTSAPNQSRAYGDA